ncbi:Kinesin light chain [Lasiodiplodia theobromae]|uniref:Kinesin light chain n=1 Tax=Lasiodiplodia theobromae TaxID=45133 RepID=UPI0015C3C344|nr:Kinesin light chain [Lasiodiplodia theobromae]KAF4545956.1 Kinesin light chain [Lasiodiplodia theobromae]
MAASRYLRTDYNVAWICPLPDVELIPARLMLDEHHDPPSIDTNYDDNTYICGTIKGHRVVIAALPRGLTGNVNAGRLTGSLFKSFPNIKIALLVGIGGGVPRSEPSNDPLEDIHLGDVVVGWPGDGKPGVIYHDLGRAMVNDEFEIVGAMDKPEWRILNALSLLSSNQEMEMTAFPEQLSRLQGRPKFAMPDVKQDRLFQASYHHVGDKGSSCESCDLAQLVQRPVRTDEQRKTFVFHQGRIATAPWRVPFQRNQRFVGREAEIQALSQMLSSSETCERAAIWGLGGCGKTAIALEFAYRTRKQHPRCAVFWVPAISRKSFLDAYRDIGMLLQIPNIQDEDADVKQLVQRELSGERSGQWLMVVDNADDIDVLFQEDTDGTRLIDCLPNGRRGSLLFTTRTRKAATAEAENNIIPLPEMEKNEARKVLEKSLLKKSLMEDDAIDKFLEDLSYLPLAIVQAAAFINQNDISISKYTSLLQNQDEIIELLSENFEDYGRYRETKNPIATTWIISFDQIRTQDPLAARILSFISCILRENIPASLLPHGNSEVKQTKAIGTLTAYAFITERENQQQKHKSYDTHRLVHLATQNWLKMNQQWTFQVQEVSTQLLEIMPDHDPKTRETWAPYLPHALCVATRAEEVEIKKLGELWSWIGNCQDALGHYGASEEPFRKALQITEKEMGKEHPRTLELMLSFAGALRKRRKHVEAEQVLRKVAALRERTLGREHSETLDTMVEIGNTLVWQEKFAEAEQVHREVLVLREKELGKQHEDTLESMAGLADALVGQDKYDEAERLYREVLAKWKKTPVEIDHQLLASMNSLAIVLSYQRKVIEAEEMYRQCLALATDFYGKNHPNTLRAMGNLAVLFQDRENYVEAEEMFRKAATLSEELLGREDPRTLEFMEELERVLKLQGKNIEAQEIDQVVLR